MTIGGKVLEISIAGRRYRIGQPGLEVPFEAAERVESLRVRRLEEALDRCGRLQGPALEAALAQAFEWHQKIVTDRDIAAWLESPAGAVFTLWHGLRKCDGTVTEDEARAVYQSLDGEQFVQIARFFAEGLGLPGASSRANHPDPREERS